MRAEGEELESFGSRLEAPHRLGGDPNRIPLRKLEDVVVELHATAPRNDDVRLLLLAVAVAERLTDIGREPLLAQARPLRVERTPGEPRLHVRRETVARGRILERLQVPERVAGHGPTLHGAGTGAYPLAVSGFARGSTMPKVLPRPTVDSTHTRPFCASTNSLTIASPIPVPGLARAPSAR